MWRKPIGVPVTLEVVGENFQSIDTLKEGGYIAGMDVAILYNDVTLSHMAQGGSESELSL